MSTFVFWTLSVMLHKLHIFFFFFFSCTFFRSRNCYIKEKNHNHPFLVLIHLLMFILLVIGWHFLSADQFRYVIKQKMHMSVYFYWKWVNRLEFLDLCRICWSSLAYHHVAYNSVSNTIKPSKKSLFTHPRNLFPT